ncbi:hypothetical protein [Priestia megaterium]
MVIWKSTQKKTSSTDQSFASFFLTFIEAQNFEVRPQGSNTPFLAEAISKKIGSPQGDTLTFLSLYTVLCSHYIEKQTMEQQLKYRFIDFGRKNSKK